MLNPKPNNWLMLALPLNILSKKFHIITSHILLVQ